MKIFFVFFVICFNSYALDEKEVVKSVLKNFLLIQEAENKVDAAKGELTSAEGEFDFKLSFKSRNRIEDKYDNNYFETSIERRTAIGGLGLIAGHRQGLGHFPAYDGKYSTSGAGEIFAGLTQPILRNFITDEFRTNLKIKELENKQAQLDLELKKMVYVHKALSLYYKWVLESQKLKINKAVLELAESRNSMLKKKFKAGDIESLKVVDNQRSIDKRKSEVIKNEIELNKVRTQLSLYLRDDQGLPILIPEEPKPEMILTKEEILDLTSSVEKNPQVEILKLEREKLTSQRDFFEQSQLPGLNLEILGARELSSNNPYDPQSLQMGIKFDFPLENRKAEGKTVAFSYKLKAIEKNQRYIESELLQNLNFFSNASFESKKRWEVTTREYENSLKMAEAEKLRWGQGASDLFVVNIREQDLADVDIRRWSALYDYHQYFLDAHLFSGTILDHYTSL